MTSEIQLLLAPLLLGVSLLASACAPMHATPDDPFLRNSAGGYGRPDLVVSSLTFTPIEPKPGEAVVFSAVVTNLGYSATPEGIVVRVRFEVDGRTVTWSDNSLTSLASGESRSLTANSGTNQTNSWVAAAGTHTLRAHVNDVRQIEEANLSNNTLSIPLTIVPPGLKTSDVSAELVLL